MRKKSAVIIGSYGCGNRGDDAILESIVNSFPELEIKAFCGKENDLDFIKVKKIRCRLNEGFSLKILVHMLIDSIGILFNILTSDLVIYGGGSLIHDLTWYNLPFMYLWHLIAIIARKKVYYFCIGIGPMTTNRGKSLSKFFLSKATKVYPRDNRGKKICDDLDIRNCTQLYDAAFLEQRRDRCQLRTLRENNLIQKDYICVTASEWFGSSNFWNKDNMDFEKQINDLAVALEKIMEKYKKTLVFVPTVKLDYNLALKLKKIIKSNQFIIISPEYNAIEMAEIIENSYFLIGTRMHSIIFAARQSVPFIAMIYDQKVAELLNLLDMKEYAFDLNQLSNELLINKVEMLIADYKKIQVSLDKKRSIFYSTIYQQGVKEIRDNIYEK